PARSDRPRRRPTGHPVADGQETSVSPVTGFRRLRTSGFSVLRRLPPGSTTVSKVTASVAIRDVDLGMHQRDQLRAFAADLRPFIKESLKSTCSGRPSLAAFSVRLLRDGHVAPVESALGDTGFAAVVRSSRTSMQRMADQMMLSKRFLLLVV